MDLNGRVAIVTGGAIRVGRAITLALAGAGCHVFIHYGSSAGPALETKAAAEALGVRAVSHSANLASVDEVEGVVSAAVRAFGPIDILVNSAAIFPEDDGFSTTDAGGWELLMGVNLRAPYLLSRAFAEQVSANERGAIVNVLDARVRQPDVDHFVYRLSKSTLWTLTEMMALELAPRIRANGVALGAILPPPGKEQQYLDDLAREKVPLQRAGSPEIVAENVLHLLRQDFLTGVVIPIDGGQFLRGAS